MADIAEIDTRSPPSTMHEVDFAVVDANGRISTAIEGAFSGEELREAVDEVTR